MKDYRIIEVKESVYKNNDERAEQLRGEMKKQGTFLLNLMASPGAGKTSTLKQTIASLKDDLRIGIKIGRAQV